jgi:hypothetical protein
VVLDIEFNLLRIISDTGDTYIYHLHTKEGRSLQDICLSNRACDPTCDCEYSQIILQMNRVKHTVWEPV